MFQLRKIFEPLTVLTIAVVVNLSVPTPSAQAGPGCVHDAIQTERNRSGPFYQIGAEAFFDRMLSKDGALACADCHEPKYLYSNRLALRDTDLGKARRRIQGLLNIGKERWFFWDGRAASLEQAVLLPLFSSSEMGSDVAFIESYLRGKQEYGAIFDSAAVVKWLRPESEHSEPATVQQILAKGLASFVRSLVSCGGTEAIVAAERPQVHQAIEAGRELFFGRAGCANCHFGELFSDGQFHNVRVRPIREFDDPDSGRYGVIAKSKKQAPSTQDDRFSALILAPELWGAFKTPSLRNIALRPPYMHQGQFWRLEDVIEHYSTFAEALPEDHHYRALLKPLGLADVEKKNLVEFLRSLSDGYYSCSSIRDGKVVVDACAVENKRQ